MLGYFDLVFFVPELALLAKLSFEQAPVPAFDPRTVR